MFRPFDEYDLLKIIGRKIKVTHGGINDKVYEGILVPVQETIGEYGEGRAKYGIAYRIANPPKINHTAIMDIPPATIVGIDDKGDFLSICVISPWTENHYLKRSKVNEALDDILRRNGM